MSATEVVRVDAQTPDSASLERAATILRGGGLVAFPTETVYGLGANALDEAAVRRIFDAKGRPATNPVIVHVASFDDLGPLVRDMPDRARILAERFWPGPLTLVLPKSGRVPDIVTAGGPTVAVRVPSHPVALALLQASRLPLAAPSANRSTCLSPTRADHVLRGLDGRIDLLLDAGPTPGGIESTVLDVSVDSPVLLRPGLVGAEAIEAVVRPIVRRPSLTLRVGDTLRSPGLMEKHYAPRTSLEYVPDTGEELVRRFRSCGLRVGWLPFGTVNYPPDPNVQIVPMPTEPESYAARLYDALHLLDDSRLDRIVAALPPEDDAWMAVHDRLSRAGRPAENAIISDESRLQ
jgi:L-threonylcarbamoyladenylate synthase